MNDSGILNNQNIWLRKFKSEFDLFQFLSVVLKGISILSSAAIVPILIKNHGLHGLALFSLAAALVYVIASMDLGIANLINSTSRHDVQIREERLRLSAIILTILLFLYIGVLFISYSFFPNWIIVFTNFHLKWILGASYLVILNSLGMKLLLMEGQVRRYQFTNPIQLILSNVFILLASAHFDLEFITFVYFLLANFSGSMIAFHTMLIKLSVLKFQGVFNSLRKNSASLMTFQYLQLLAIFNSQGIILLISRFFGLEIVAFYSFSSRIFQSVNQIYSQLIADYWNRITRLHHAAKSEMLFSCYLSEVKKSIIFGCFVNGGIVLLGPALITFFLSEEYNFLLFLSLGLYWTCTLVFMPMSYTFNGLLYTRGQIIWQGLFSAVSVPLVILCGVFNQPLSIGIMILSFVLICFVLPMSNRDLKRHIVSIPMSRDIYP